MIPALILLAVTIGVVCYLVGRLVGEERGRVDAYRRVAEVRRRESESRR